MNDNILFPHTKRNITECIWNNALSWISRYFTLNFPQLKLIGSTWLIGELFHLEPSAVIVYPDNKLYEALIPFSSNLLVVFILVLNTYLVLRVLQRIKALNILIEPTQLTLTYVIATTKSILHIPHLLFSRYCHH